MHLTHPVEQQEQESEEDEERQTTELSRGRTSVKTEKDGQYPCEQAEALV